MAQENGLETRVAELERRVAELAVRPASGSKKMTFKDLIAYMQMHGEELRPIFDAALKLREKDREKARRRFAREDARNSAQKKPSAARPRAKT